MFDLLKIRELILKQDKELEKALYDYVEDINKNKYIDVSRKTLDIEKVGMINLNIANKSGLFSNVDKNMINIFDLTIQFDIQKMRPSDVINIIQNIALENNIKHITILYKTTDNLELLEELKNNFTLVYYSKELYFLENNDNFENKGIILEKANCDKSDIIITDNINIYNYKKIVERRKNIYLVNNNINEKFELHNVLRNYDKMDDKFLMDSIRSYSENLSDRYQKLLYFIASQSENMQNCIDLCEYAYKKYNTKEVYQLYISLLGQSKDYMNIVEIVTKTDYCEDIYKSEMIYLESTKYYDLLEFIVQISVNNYTVFDDVNGLDEYKMAIYYLVLNKYNESIDEYNKLLNSEDYVLDSPFINKNMSYLMNIIKDDRYREFYDRYNLLMNECLALFK